MEHSDNGMMTKIWGRPGWMFNHTITFGYPLHPTDEEKKSYRKYFLALGDVLPCKYCRESYNYFVTHGDTKLTDDDLTSRSKLVSWLYRVHQAVNKKLGVDYGMTEDRLISKYESFRAKCSKGQTGCLAPLDYRAFSYSRLYEEDAPIIPLDLAKKFIPLARTYDLDHHAIFLDSTIKAGGYQAIMDTPLWHKRNQVCSDLIKRMKLLAIPSLVDGQPTYEETALIMYGCSNLSINELNKIINQ